MKNILLDKSFEALYQIYKQSENKEDTHLQSSHHKIQEIEGLEVERKLQN
jgi:hypothetical protein